MELWFFCKQAVNTHYVSELAATAANYNQLFLDGQLTINELTTLCTYVNIYETLSTQPASRHSMASTKDFCGGNTTSPQLYL